MSGLSSIVVSKFSLPVETWLRIFETLTCDPAAMNTAERDLFLFDVAGEALPRKRPLNTTALALIQVCRNWRALATQFLYRYIAVYDDFSLDLLRRTLLDSQTSNNVGLKVYVWRLDVSADLCTAKSNKLPEVLSLLPRLRIVHLPWKLTVSGLNVICPDIFTSLSSSHDSIQSLDFSDCTVVVNPRDMREFLANTPHLRILNLSRHHSSEKNFTVSSLRPVILPELHTLYVPHHKSFPIIEGDSFPHLHRLMFLVRDARDIYIWQKQLRQCGRQLTSAILCILRDSDHVQHIMDIVSASCPCLTHLSIMSDRDKWWPRYLNLHHITHISVPRRRYDVQTFFGNVLTLQGLALQVVQVPFAMVQQLVALPDLHRKILLCHFRVEDGHGRPLTDYSIMPI